MLFDSAMKQAEHGSDPWQQAVLGKAICAHHMTPCTKENIDEATALYRMLVTECPNGKYTPRAMMHLGRIDELVDYYIGGKPETVDLPGARKWYEKVVQNWPDDPIAGEATLRIAGTYIQTFDEAQVRQGTSILESWLKDHPNDPLASAMWQYLGDTYFFPIANYSRAVACYRKADDLGLILQGRKGTVYWRTAVLADRYLHDRDTAVLYYTKIIEQAPNSGKGYESQLALNRLGAPAPEIRMFAKPEPTTMPLPAAVGAP